MFCISSNGINKGELWKQTKKTSTFVKCATETFLKINIYFYPSKLKHFSLESNNRQNKKCKKKSIRNKKKKKKTTLK